MEEEEAENKEANELLEDSAQAFLAIEEAILKENQKAILESKELKEKLHGAFKRVEMFLKVKRKEEMKCPETIRASEMEEEVPNVKNEEMELESGGKTLKIWVRRSKKMIVLNGNGPSPFKREKQAQPKQKTFHFDRIFGEDSKPDEVFTRISPLVSSAFDGFSTAIFCFGAVSLHLAPIHPSSLENLLMFILAFAASFKFLWCLETAMTHFIQVSFQPKTGENWQKVHFDQRSKPKELGSCRDDQRIPF